MDEQAFKQRYNQHNAQPCIFEKALLTRCYQCQQHQRIMIAGREGMACQSVAGRQMCQRLYHQLKQHANFSLGLTQIGDTLPHGKQMKLLCGGLNGIKVLLAPDKQSDNIYQLLQTIQQHYGDLDAVPYNEVVKSVTQYQGRKRHRKRK